MIMETVESILTVYFQHAAYEKSREDILKNKWIEMREEWS
jgi:hypothetical protein